MEAKEKTKAPHCISEHKLPAATTGAASLLSLLLAKFQFIPQHVLFHLQTSPGCTDLGCALALGMLDTPL